MATGCFARLDSCIVLGSYKTLFGFVLKNKNNTVLRDTPGTDVVDRFHWQKVGVRCQGPLEGFVQLKW